MYEPSFPQSSKALNWKNESKYLKDNK